MPKPSAKLTGKDAAPALTAKATKVREGDKRRAEELLASIARRKERITEDFYEIGTALRELLRKKLYVALGHASFADMLSARNVMGAMTAKRLIEVVEKVPLKQALQLGPERAYALARYTAATPELDTPAGLLESGAKIGGKKVADASLREITQAGKQVRAKTKPNGAASPEQTAAEKAVREVGAWLRGRKVRGASVTAKRGANGHEVVIVLPVAAAAVLTAIRD
ncbi:MAG: hypothetical protein IPK82_35255 [Polyangiaceae bacterium]|nr:hypothetical protein [Polyangiaceae bacterium]